MYGTVKTSFVFNTNEALAVDRFDVIRNKVYTTEPAWSHQNEIKGATTRTALSKDKHRTY